MGQRKQARSGTRGQSRADANARKRRDHHTLHFENPSRSNTLVIVPPDPQSTNEGNILGHSPRQLGIGMVEIKIVSSAG
jgi:hypothetical protein